MSGNEIIAKIGGRSIAIRGIGEPVKEYLANTSPYLSVRLDRPVAFYTGEARSMNQLKEIVQTRRSEQEAIYKKCGVLAPSYQALQSVIGWIGIRI